MDKIMRELREGIGGGDYPLLRKLAAEMGQMSPEERMLVLGQTIATAIVQFIDAAATVVDADTVAKLRALLED